MKIDLFAKHAEIERHFMNESGFSTIPLIYRYNFT